MEEEDIRMVDKALEACGALKTALEDGGESLGESQSA